MYKPKITIIMAVYNRVDKVEQCILSVLNQSYDNLEYIIIDGGSSDGTVDVIQKYADKISYWCSEPDNGIYSAWNKGISHATGDYINFIGSDDAMYDSNVVENIARYLDTNVDVLAGRIAMVKENSGFEVIVDNEHVKDREHYSGRCITTQGTFIKRELCCKYKFDTSYKVAADYKFFLKYYYDGSTNIKFVDDIIQYFSDGGISCSSNCDSVKDEDNRVYKDLGLYWLVDCHKKLENSPKGKVKAVFKKLGLLNLVQSLYSPYIRPGWRKHHCNNKICRWCGRK